MFVYDYVAYVPDQDRVQPAPFVYTTYNRPHPAPADPTPADSQNLYTHVQNDYVEKIRKKNDGIDGAGLQNGGNRCYFNASLKALRACPYFWNFVREKKASNSIAKRLSSFFKKCTNKKLIVQRSGSYHKDPSSIDKVASVLQNYLPQVQEWQQQDAEEVIRVILQELKCGPFSFQETHFHSLQEEGFSVPSLDVPYIDQSFLLSIGIPQSTHPISSLQEIFSGFIQNEEVDFDSVMRNLVEKKKENEIKNLRSFLQRFSFPRVWQIQVSSIKRFVKQAPSLLPIHIKRYRSNGTKNNQRMTIPLILETTVVSSQKIHEEKYILRSVIAHAGNSISSGHYYTYVPDPTTINYSHGTWSCSYWIEHNDSSVVQKPFSCIQQDLEKNSYIIFYERIIF